MKDLNYVVGRLQGLNELVKILKDLVDKKGAGDSEIVSVITDHISDQLTSILSEFDSIKVEPRHKEALAEIKEKHTEAQKQAPASVEEAKKAPAAGNQEQLEKHEKTVDELLKDLESLKTK